MRDSQEGGVDKASEMLVSVDDISDASALFYEGDSIKERFKSERIELRDARFINDPAEKLINLVLRQAIEDYYGELRFERFDNSLKMRCESDGVIYEMIPPPFFLWKGIKNGLESLFGTVEKTVTKEYYGFLGFRSRERVDIIRLLKSGQKAMIPVSCNGKTAALTLSKIRTYYKDQYKIKFFHNEFRCDGIFSDMEEDIISRGIPHKSGGLDIIASSPGHGRTSTAHAILDMLNRPDRVVLAVGGDLTKEGIHHMPYGLEIPVEELYAQIGRLNPGVVYLDDIPKREHAEMAIRLAWEGKTVLAGLPMSDVVYGLKYLVNILGINNKNLAEVFSGGISQRLVRKPHNCEDKYKSDEELAGCKKCGYTGYKGRVAARQILLYPDSENLKNYIRDNDIKHDGIPDVSDAVRNLVDEGVTSEEEYQQIC